VLIFATHSTSTDNEAGIASGHRDVALSDLGRRQAAAMRFDVDAVYCSDLKRAVETAQIAFGDAYAADPRLREQDYGERTGAPSAEVELERMDAVDVSFPGGESLRDVAHRVDAFLSDLREDRVLVIAHRAIKLAFDHLLAGMALEDAVAAHYAWQPSWTYELGARATPS
jgi:broad specificity phosphatase PhoE